MRHPVIVSIALAAFTAGHMAWAQPAPVPVPAPSAAAAPAPAPAAPPTAVTPPAPPAAAAPPAPPTVDPLLAPKAQPAPEAPLTPVAPAPLPPAPAASVEPAWSDRLVLDTGRVLPAKPERDAVFFSIHGEYQLRYVGQSDVRLTPPLSGDTRPASLGQSQYLYHWLRLNPRLDFRDSLSLIAQIDIPRGLVVGDTTQFVDQSRDPLSEQRWYGVYPRWLYLEYRSPIGTFRAGQQGSHWGMGILANDGDHPSMFGDNRRGSLSERLLFATNPMGKGTPLLLVLAGDLIFQDNTADLYTNGDKAFQGVAAAVWHEKRGELGLYGVYRHQARSRVSTGDLTPYTESLNVGVLDVTGKFNADIQGTRAMVYGQMEAAAIFGSTSFLRGSWLNSNDPLAPKDDEKVRSFGASAVLGVVHVSGKGKERWGGVVGELEYGYASGDANPNDGTTKRFTFDPNHHVGLVLFDHVMRWKTARAATIAQDPHIVDRATPGAQLLASNGGVFGATYLNPRMIFRPRRWLDLKAGAVIAQSTADFVDPFHVGALGSFQNYDGGSSRHHDLGVELDMGFDTRIALEGGSVVQLGAEGGVLFPGHAFDDADGNGLPNQYLGQLKVGLQH